jgi:hypothetical protein
MLTQRDDLDVAESDSRGFGAGQRAETSSAYIEPHTRAPRAQRTCRRIDGEPAPLCWRLFEQPERRSQLRVRAHVAVANRALQVMPSPDVSPVARS